MTLTFRATQVLTPFLDSFSANIAVEPFTGPPQAGSRRAAPQQSRVERHPGTPAGLHAGERLVPRDSPLPTFLPRFPPRARPPPRGLRSRAVQTVHLIVCPSVCQVPKNKAPRRLPRSSACPRKQSAMMIPCLLSCDLLFHRCSFMIEAAACIIWGSINYMPLAYVRNL